MSIKGTYQVVSKSGALLGSFSHGDTPNHDAIAAKAADDRAQEMRAQGERCKVIYRDAEGKLVASKSGKSY